MERGILRRWDLALVEGFLMGDAEPSHVDDEGRLRMVDVGDKEVTARSASASAAVYLPEPCRRVLAGEDASPKGNILEAARLAGIAAAKRTSELIPLCHLLPLDQVAVDLELAGDRLLISASAKCRGRTGVEMEALTAASVAALTVYDMLKAMSHELVIENVELARKSGGRHGTVERRTRC